MKNPNHPKKGDSIRVEPIREPKDIKSIKRLLDDKPRDYCLFVMGINTNLRASDLLKIKVGQVRYLSPGEHFTIKEKKTSKPRNITLNKTVFDAIRRLLEEMGNDFDDTALLFQSRKGNGQLSTSSLNALVKSWCKAINLRGNFGSHTLRKTWGYQQRVQFNTSVPILMECFNHSSQRMTLQYLGIQPTELRDTFMQEI